jgi:hypothetical protein
MLQVPFEGAPGGEDKPTGPMGGQKMNYYLKDIDPELWRKVKSRAAAEGKSIKGVIVELLKKWLREKK